jgi:hypothetical protein
MKALLYFTFLDLFDSIRFDSIFVKVWIESNRVSPGSNRLDPIPKKIKIESNRTIRSAQKVGSNRTIRFDPRSRSRKIESLTSLPKTASNSVGSSLMSINLGKISARLQAGGSQELTLLSTLHFVYATFSTSQRGLNSISA